MKAANLQIRDLMTTIIETLDMTEQRGEIIRYALNSEIFYAFQVSYLISLLKKIALTAPYQGQLITTTPLQPSFQKPQLPNNRGSGQLDDDVRDLLKTV